MVELVKKKKKTKKKKGQFILPMFIERVCSEREFSLSLHLRDQQL